MTDPTIKGVVFDLGGVVLESPLHVIGRFEREMSIRPGAINQAVVAAGGGGAWARFERGELDAKSFEAAFARDCAAVGAEVDVSALMALIGGVTVRPTMLETIDRLRRGGRMVAALTNNFAPLARSLLYDSFDVVVESSVEGTRKPEKRIYEIVLDRLGLEATAVLFLDDIGANLKPARAMGMHTIKVTDPASALDQMWSILNASG